MKKKTNHDKEQQEGKCETESPKENNKNGLVKSDNTSKRMEGFFPICTTTKN